MRWLRHELHYWWNKSTRNPKFNPWISDCRCCCICMEEEYRWRKLR